MSKKFNIQISEIVGSDLCIASDEGQKVYEEIATALRKELKVELSFLNVTTLTSAFLNAAIGQLYSGEFPADKIKKSLSVSNIDQDDLALLKRVVETAKEYFKDPKRFEAARKEVLGDDDE